MNTRPSLYRSTLIAAAVAIGGGPGRGAAAAGGCTGWVEYPPRGAFRPLPPSPVPSGRGGMPVMVRLPL